MFLKTLLLQLFYGMIFMRNVSPTPKEKKGINQGIDGFKNFAKRFAVYQSVHLGLIDII